MRLLAAQARSGGKHTTVIALALGQFENFSSANKLCQGDTK